MDRVASSFRDPSGFIFKENGSVYRQINPVYFPIYNDLKDKKLFDLLWAEDLIIRHQEVKNTAHEIILKPEEIPFISYPYEWSFS